MSEEQLQKDLIRMENWAISYGAFSSIFLVVTAREGM